MLAITRILCPTTLTPESDEALRYAVALARAYGARLLLLHCREAAGGENIKARFEESLSRHLGLADFARLDWEGLVAGAAEDPGEVIVREAAEQRAELIVMRSRRRPRAAALLGSTAERVCRAAPCPVLVTHPREREWVGASTGEVDLRRLIVAQDFSTDSEVALRYGMLLAQEYQAELHLLHVLDFPEGQGPEIDWGIAGREDSYRRAEEWLRLSVPEEVRLWARVKCAVRWGSPYREVLAYARDEEIDLICMGANGRHHGIAALFGSNVDRVLRQAPCPVLVARPLKPACAL